MEIISPLRPDIPFATSPSRDYYCPICLDFLVDAYQLNCCGNHLCPDCNRRVITEGEGAACPICRFSEVKSTEDKFFKRLSLRLPVRCYNHEEGCRWEGELSELSAHYDHSRSASCAYSVTQCSFGCGRTISARKMKTHKHEECPKRPTTCEYCQYHNSYDVVTQKHYPVCTEFPVECPNHCGETVSESSLGQSNAPSACYRRKQLPEHLAKCPLQQVDCTFSDVGCTVRLQRCNLSTHLEDSKDAHIQFLTEALQASRTHVAELEKQLCTNSDATPLPSPAPCVDSSLMLNLTPASFTMTGFSEKKAVGTLWFSPPFFTSKMGYMMQMRVFTNGDASSEGSHLSLFVFLMTGCYDGELQWPFRGMVVVELLNWRNNDNHYRKSIEFSDASSDSSTGRITSRKKPRSGRGKHRFIAHSELAYNPVANTEYLQDDCLRFRIHTLIYSTPLARSPSWQKQQPSQSLCECTLMDFSKHKLLGAEYHSKPFYTHKQGYKVRMKVFANGKGLGKGTHISVYMYLMAGEYDQALEWPCTITLAVELLNWKEDRNHHRRIVPFSRCTKTESTTRVMEQDQAMSGPGVAQFASYDILPQFLHNDCLRFRITHTTVQGTKL